MSLTSLNDVVATVFTLRTLVVVWWLPPLVVAALPLAVDFLLRLLNLVTRGYGLSTLLGTLLIIAAGRSFISNYSPTPRHRDDALNQSKIVLPVLSFFFCVGILQFVLVPIASLVGMKEWLTISPKLPYTLIFQIAVSFFFLGLSVVLRYFGSCSVMRCSASPTVARPLTATLRTYLSDGIMALLASDTPGVLIQSPLRTDSTNNGRRYHGPPLPTALLLLMVSGFLAWIAGQVLSWSSSDASFALLATFVTCITVVLHMFCTCLDGKSHEMNPVRYQSLGFSWNQFKTYLESFALTTGVVPIVAYLCYFSSNQHDATLMSNGALIAIYFTAFVYLSLVDLACHMSLCASRSNLYSIVVEVTEDMTLDTTMTVMVKSILLDDGASVKAVLTPTSTLISNRQEEEELARHNDVSEKMAQALVKKPTSDFDLPEDMLRTSLILGRLGGKDSVGAGKTWISAKTSHEAGRIEPLAAPIVRALCAYTAGMGIALVKIFGDKKKAPTWSLPPGALYNCELAITAAARFVVESIGAIGAADWRTSPLAVFVQSVLVTAFELRKGLLAFEKETGVNAGGEKACDNAASLLLHTLRSLNGVRSIELHIQQKDCRVWLEELVAGVPQQASLLPVLVRESDKSGGFLMYY